jgi:thermitase
MSWSTRVIAAVLTALLALSTTTATAADITPDIPVELPPHHPTTILVRVAEGWDAPALHQRLGFEIANRIAALGIDVVAVPRGGVADAVRRYSEEPGVVYAEPNYLLRLSATPNDAFITDQYALWNIGAARAWDRYGHRWRTTGGTRIAVIDSGVDRFHPEFAGKISHCRSWITGLGVAAEGCQDLQIHGTHVAGIAAARANNREGIAGVAFDAEIMALQAFNSAGSAVNADVIAAMVFAARNGAKVANYSFGGPTSSAAQREAVTFVANKGVTQVAAAGNTGTEGVEYPANLPEVIAVSSTTERDRLADTSTYGADVELAAPGDQVLSTVPGQLLYARMSGTSMAAPHVAGVAALLRARGLSMRETRRRLRNTVDDLGADGRDLRFGYGRINAARALR